MSARDGWGDPEIAERFEGGRLDQDIWTASYLPAWSSQQESAASYSVDGEGLHLTIPADQGLWCPDLHDGPLKVSAVQSGNWSGPVGSTRGQQPFRDGLVVREEQPTRWGFTPHYDYVEVECRARISARSMFSAWMVGLEDEPDRCGEICIVEVFGEPSPQARQQRAALGSGVHRFRDPKLREEFAVQSRPIDVAANHRYAVDWRPGRVDFFVDDVMINTVDEAPDYPLQLILGVFDFPDRALPDEKSVPVPELVVRSVTGRAGSGLARFRLSRPPPCRACPASTAIPRSPRRRPSAANGSTQRSPYS